jgi:hypothetical protein
VVVATCVDVEDVVVDLVNQFVDAVDVEGVDGDVADLDRVVVGLEVVILVVADRLNDQDVTDVDVGVQADDRQ